MNIKRCKNFVLEGERGLTFQLVEKTNGEIEVEVRKLAEVSDYSENYVTPYIPAGFKHICGKWNNGLTIEKISDGSQFDWIPVGRLDSDGTLDGIHFSQKFGRRKFKGNEFSEEEYNKGLNNELIEQWESVKKYGGFYISSYNISLNSEGKPQSVKGAMPLVQIDLDKAKEIAHSFENREDVKSHLTFESEYETVLAWLIKSKAKKLEEIEEDSTEWGNYANSKNSPKELLKTGSYEKGCVNNIYDLAGNVDEWAQKDNNVSMGSIYGADYGANGKKYPVSSKLEMWPNFYFRATGFRVVLWLK